MTAVPGLVLCALCIPLFLFNPHNPHRWWGLLLPGLMETQCSGSHSWCVAELGLEHGSLILGHKSFQHASRTFLARLEMSNYVKGTFFVSCDFGRTLCNLDLTTRFIFMVNFLLYYLLLQKSSVFMTHEGHFLSQFY